MNLSFAGCGFLGIYHVGVAVCFKKYAPHLLLNKISGASAGAISACALLCDLPLGDMTSDVLRVCTEARSRSLGPFNPSFNIQKLLLEGLEKVLPDDAHKRVSGKLHISLTRVYDGKNVIISEFETRDDLVQALLASSFIPLFSGILPPKYHGVRYIDGGFSDNLPTLDENTITVSPFCGESDICPRDDSSQLFHINVANTSIELSRHNIYRIGRILFPPKPEILANMCKQGFDDALRFLHRNNLINCTRCLAVQSTFVVDKVDENIEYDPQCHECKKHRQEALVSNMPETVVTIFQEAIEKANNGLVNWVFKHRGMKLLSVLSLPYTIPADVMYATITKLSAETKKLSIPSFASVTGSSIELRTFQYRVLGNGLMMHDRHLHFISNTRLMTTAPKMGNTFWEGSKYLMEQLVSILNKVNMKRQQLSAKITCQLNITEYGADKFDVEAPELSSPRNQMNLNFTLNLDESEDMHIDGNTGRKFSATRMLSKRPSLSITRTDSGDNDTFEHILQVTAQHEAIMAYYYMDENNKVKVTEIFDVTDCDSPVVQTATEREMNSQLEFDDEWGETDWHAQHQPADLSYLNERRQSMEELSDFSLDDLLDRDAANIFSDPESEWNSSYKVEEPEDELCANLRPESDQPEYVRGYKVTAFDHEK